MVCSFSCSIFVSAGMALNVRAGLMITAYER